MSILKIKEGQELTKFPNTKIEIIVKVFLISVYKFIKNLTEDDIILFIYKCLPTFITLATAFPVTFSHFSLSLFYWPIKKNLHILYFIYIFHLYTYSIYIHIPFIYIFHLYTYSIYIHIPYINKCMHINQIIEKKFLGLAIE